MIRRIVLGVMVVALLAVTLVGCLNPIVPGTALAQGEMCWVVRHIPTDRLVYRESPDFASGMGIANYIATEGGNSTELEEVYVSVEDWEAELLLRLADNLPHSQHIGLLTGVNPSQAKPATVTRKYVGETFTEQCLVSQSIVDMWIADTLNVGDYVIVSYIDEHPNTEEVNLVIVVDKVYDSWS